MNKSELIQTLKEKSDVSLTYSEKIVNTFFDAISDALASGDRVEIRGFGTFAVNNYKAYTGRNPKTGAKIKVQAKKLPFFRVGKELREIVDKLRGG